MNKIFLVVVLLIILGQGCISKKKYLEQTGANDILQKKYEALNRDYLGCKSELERLNNDLKMNQKEVIMLKDNSNVLLTQLSELSVITQSQAESIKKSLENINSKDAYIKDLQVAMSRKDSLNMALVLNLKGALKDINDQDIEIKVEGSAVFISISDKMLFKSGSYEITSRANEILGKVATVLKSQPQLQFMVEGHTDNKPIHTAFIKDNWDLSVLRATAVVRALQINFAIDPSRMIAAGRSEFVPIAENNSDNNRMLNRRTRIVILPQLDQFFKLIEPKK